MDAFLIVVVPVAARWSFALLTKGGRRDGRESWDLCQMREASLYGLDDGKKKEGSAPETRRAGGWLERTVCASKGGTTLAAVVVVVDANETAPFCIKTQYRRNKM